MTIDTSTLTSRETVATLLNSLDALHDLGLPADAVFQADTADNPMMRPFIVIRWYDWSQVVAGSSVRPFDLYVYDEPGDYTRADRIGFAAAAYLDTVTSQKTDTGFISQFLTKGSGYGRGTDLYDTGYKAIVLPWRLAAVATGV